MEALFYSQPGVASLLQPIVVLAVAIAVLAYEWRQADP